MVDFLDAIYPSEPWISTLDHPARNFFDLERARRGDHGHAYEFQVYFLLTGPDLTTITFTAKMTTQVLDQDHPDTRHENANEQPDVTPLPWGQLLIIFLIQFAEPVTAAVIYPFINPFVRATGVTGGDEEKTGYFAGMIVRT